MKKLFFNSVALLISAASFAQSGAQLEFKMTSTKGPTGTFVVKHSEYGSKANMNMVVPQMPGGGIQMTTLMKKDNPDVTYTLNEANKTYTERKKTEAKEATDNNIYTVKKIGEEKVNGYKCIHALVTQGKETHDIWNTKDFPDYAKYAEAMNSNEKMGSHKRYQALKDAGCEGFPVKTVYKNERDGELTMELVKMEKKNFSKSDFEIPADYKKSESNNSSTMPAGMKTQQEIMAMSPEERAKYIEEMKKKYGK
ncbi:MAG: DUF4412 domain-containing protein [Bacteroidia bacterium]|nr:DUF4412 domain-containing protein [Bacteroidia bacterium]